MPTKPNPHQHNGSPVRLALCKSKGRTLLVCAGPGDAPLIQAERDEQIEYRPELLATAN